MASKENLKILIDAEIRARLNEILDRKKITLTAGVEAMVSWFLEQDDLFQSIILGQISKDSQGDVAQLILERMASARGKTKTSLRKAV